MGETIDLRLLEYVANVDDNLICPICRCPLIDPVRLQCDHTFCRECVKSAFLGEVETLKPCPTCRVCTKGMVTTSIPRFVTSMLDELRVKCPKHLFGCEVQMRRCDVQDHLAHYCVEVEQECSSTQCTLRIARRRKGQRCLHQWTVCTACGKSLMEKDLEVRVQHAAS